MGSQYKVSPIGTFVHPWVTKPDTKYNADGLYHTGLRVEGPEAEAFKEEVKALSDAFHEEHTKEMKKGERDKWSVYYPFEEEVDDDGAPTGAVIFQFKQNAIIKLRDGAKKSVKIGVRNANDQATKENIFGGDKGRVMWSSRGIPISSAKQAGVRLDFAMVQLVAKGERTGGGGFGKVEGGFVDDQADGNESEAQDADY